MSKLKTVVLPRLLLAGALYQFIEIFLRIRLHQMAPAWGSFGKSPTFELMTLGAAVAQTFSLGVLCFVLAFVSRAYYAKDETLAAWMNRFSWAADGYCIFYALNSLPSAWITARQFLDAGSLIQTFAGAFTMLGFVPVVATILILKDLLAECLVLREETAHTV